MHRSAYAAAVLSVLALVACTVQSSRDSDEETSPASPAAPAEQQEVAEAGAEAPAEKSDASPATEAGSSPSTSADAGAKPDAAPGKSTMTVNVSNEKLPLETFTATVSDDAMKLEGQDKKKDRQVIVTLPKGVTAGTFPCDATHSISYDDDTDRVLTNRGVQGHEYRPKAGLACSIVVEAAGAEGMALRGKMTGKLAFDYRIVLANKTDTVDLAGTFSFVRP